MRLPIYFCIIVFILLSACKKDNSENKYPPHLPNETDNTIVFVNAADPRLAQTITNQKQRIIFYGTRDSRGMPQRLTGYSVTNLHTHQREVLVTFDSEGKYSGMFLSSGEGMHFDYSIKDSIIVTIANSNGLVQKTSIKNLTRSSLSKKNNINADLFYSRSSEAGIIQREVEKIDVKVSSLNLSNSKKSDVNGNETVVLIRIIGQNFDYELPAPYDPSTGFYSLDLSLTGIVTETDVVAKTLNLIKKTLAIACLNPNSGDNTIDDILINITAGICRIPHPTAKILCYAGTSLVVACKAGEIINFINSTVKNTPNPPLNAAIIIQSRHKLYGTAYSPSTTLGEVRSNLGTYDAEVTHLYSSSYTIQKVSGDNQTGLINEYLGDSLKVRITDNENNGVENIPVSFIVKSGGGNIDQTDVKTNVEGYAQAKWKAGNIGGIQTVDVYARNNDGTEISGSPLTFSSTISSKNDEIVLSNPIVNKIVFPDGNINANFIGDIRLNKIFETGLLFLEAIIQLPDGRKFNITDWPMSSDLLNNFSSSDGIYNYYSGVGFFNRGYYPGEITNIRVYFMGGPTSNWITFEVP